MQQIEAHGDQGKQVMVMSFRYKGYIHGYQGQIYTLELANRSQVSNGAIGDSAEDLSTKSHQD